MAADFDRNVNRVDNAGFLMDNVYRVNAADRDRGKAGQDQFRDTLQKKKQNPSGNQPGHPPSDDPPSAPAPPPADRVLLSGTPVAPDTAPNNATGDEDNDKKPPGHIHVTA